jgi:hypothetical protein
MKCSKCTEEFDPMEDHHGISIDGSTYVCSACLTQCARLRSGFSLEDSGCYADAKFRNEDVGVWKTPSEQAALHRVSEMAAKLWDVESFAEVN